MTDTHIITGAACTALFFIEILRVPQYIKAFLFRRFARPMHNRVKPFDCAQCLSFWIAVISGIFLGKNPGELLFNSVTASILAVLIQKILNK